MTPANMDLYKRDLKMMIENDGSFAAKVPAFVVFRMLKKKYGGCVIALFPSMNHESGDANRYKVVDYVHVGQHGECDPRDVMGMSRSAAPEEYADLKAELESLGYVLTVQRKPNWSWHLMRSARMKKDLQALLSEAEFH